MQPRIFLLALALLLPVFQFANAADKIPTVKISGNIVRETGTNGTTTTTPITVKNVLGVLGISSTEKDLHFYYSSSGNGDYLIETGSAAAAGSVSPTATFLGFTSPYLFWYDPKGNLYSPSSATALNGELSHATAYSTIIAHNHVINYTTQFIAFGILSGDNAVMKGTAVELTPEK